MTNSKMPDVSTVLTDQSGRLADVWAEYFRRLSRLLVTNEKSAADLATSKAATSQVLTESFLIENPDNKTYSFIGLQVQGTITQVITETTAGTCTVTVQIGGVALGGSANAASTTRQTQDHSTSNEIAAGDDLDIVVSGNSSAENLSITLIGTRTLA